MTNLRTKSMSEDVKLAELFQKIFDEVMDREPIYATFLGYKHEKYDHLMPDGSLKAAEEGLRIDLLLKNELVEEIDYKALSREGQLDFDLISFFLEYQLFKDGEIAFWKSGAVSGGAVGQLGTAIYLLYARDFAPLETRVKAIIGRLKGLATYLEQSKSTYVFPVKIWVELAIQEGPRTLGFLLLIQNTIQHLLTDELNQELDEEIKKATDVINDYIQWLETEQIPRATHDWVIGTQKFARLVDVRKIGKSPAEILEIGEKMLKETKEELALLASKLFPGKSVKEVREKLKDDHPPTFEMVLEHVGELTRDARNFIKEHDLMDLPKGEFLKVEPTPSFLIPILPFAAYLPAEKFSKDQTGIYIVTPTEENDEMLKEHSYASSKNVAVHEGYPGHHLQISSANLQPNLIRSIVQGEETIEGWAHYCEQLMAEKGFISEKEVFMQLLDQLWRAVRIIVDVKIHTSRMTLDEAKKLMMDEIGMAEPAVIAELNRYTSTPGYQFSYLLGKILLLELRDEVKTKLGDKYTDKFFHNTILHNGGLPIHFLRRLFDIKIDEMLS